MLQQVVTLGFAEPWQCFADFGQSAHNVFKIAHEPLALQGPLAGNSGPGFPPELPQDDLHGLVCLLDAEREASAEVEHRSRSHGGKKHERSLPEDRFWKKSYRIVKNGEPMSLTFKM